ncbi:MAG: pantoate--beta-alanine ligase [Myxococcota bacterium]
MERFTDAKSMREWSRAQRRGGARIAFVPTMGYLHEGHLSLVDEARQQADLVVASIYVNPTQFAPHEDFDVYPRDTQGDLTKLQARGCAAVFTPTDLYQGAPGTRTWIEPGPSANGLCGASRPGFFRGVTTVVSKLFHIVEPDVAVFGKKDYQQWRVISAMVSDLDMAVEVVGMPIVREHDGLALSSRNVRLSSDARQRALALVQSLEFAAEQIASGERRSAWLKSAIQQRLSASGGDVDYIAVVDPDTLLPVEGEITQAILIALAVTYDDVRLIDNRVFALD